MSDANGVETPMRDHIARIVERLSSGECRLIIEHPNPAEGTSVFPPRIAVEVGNRLSASIPAEIGELVAKLDAAAEFPIPGCGTSAERMGEVYRTAASALRALSVRNGELERALSDQIDRDISGIFPAEAKLAGGEAEKVAVSDILDAIKALDDGGIEDGKFIFDSRKELKELLSTLSHTSGEVTEAMAALAKLRELVTEHGLAAQSKANGQRGYRKFAHIRLDMHKIIDDLEAFLQGDAS